MPIYVIVFNPLLHEHFVKNGCFIEKSPVTSSNCYETMKTASILIKLGTSVDWTIAFATTCSDSNFLLPWQRGDIYKMQKKSLFCVDLFHQNSLQSTAILNGLR
jgi:hypothetical protein